MTMAGAASQKLQLLADALALEFSQSQASAQCGAALRRLLPGLEYLSITLSNPWQEGRLVASANLATEGPTTLHLHDLESSVVGLALAQGQPAQVSLLNEDSFKVVPAWTDVQQMVIAAPSVTHVLCVPFGCGSSNDSGTHEAASSGSNRTGRCQRHSPCGSGRGALLFGLSEAPNLDGRRATLLAALALCLPDPMARHSADTLAFVNYACGIVAQCTCCCPHESDSEGEGEGMEGGMGGAYHDDEDSSGPSQALRVPLGGAAGTSSPLDDGPGPSARRAGLEDELAVKGTGKAAAAAGAAPAEPATPLPRLERSESDTPAFRFSKALMTAVEEDEGITQRQHLLTLTFHSALVEREYKQWMARHHLQQGDMMISLLLVTALAIVSFLMPYRLIDSSPGSVALGLGMALPLGLSWLSRQKYMPLRTWLVFAFRIYTVAFINMTCTRSFKPDLAAQQVHQYIVLWRLTGAESLCITALGVRTYLSTHLKLQLLALLIVIWHLPRMCSSCFLGSPMLTCFSSSAAMATVFGYLLPTLVLYHVEQRSRTDFARMLRSAAAQAH